MTYYQHQVSNHEIDLVCLVVHPLAQSSEAAASAASIYQFNMILEYIKLSCIYSVECLIKFLFEFLKVVSSKIYNNKISLPESKLTKVVSIIIL